VEALQALIDGVTLGATYSLLGLGFTLVFGVMRRLNLAFGAMILVGITAGSLFHRLASGSPAITLAVTVAGAVLAGLYVEQCAFRPLTLQAPVVTMIASFAASMQLQELVSLAAPSRTLPYPAPGWIPDLTLGGLLLRGDALARWGGAVAILVVLFALLYRTRFGLGVRALADSREGALLMGVDPRTVGAVAFVLASAVGGSAGALVATSQQQVTPYFGLWATVKGLTAALLGGLGSLPGAVGGGLVLGVAETVVLWLFGGQWRDLVAYALLFGVVALHPRARQADPEAAG
jgi:branched-subunit amino acid ABC-type transport system permease component